MGGLLLRFVTSPGRQGWWATKRASGGRQRREKGDGGKGAGSTEYREPATNKIDDTASHACSQEGQDSSSVPTYVGR